MHARLDDRFAASLRRERRFDCRQDLVVIEREPLDIGAVQECDMDRGQASLTAAA